MDDGDEVIPRLPIAGTEAETLLGSLERVRGFVAWKCGGLDAAGLRATLGPSRVTLGGLLKHLARAEDEMFGVKLHGRERRSPWNAVDWDADPDWDWESAAQDSPDELMVLWKATVRRSRAQLAEALADGGLDRPAALSWRRQHANVRRLLIDIIEEYARHAGHADLIRESIDGVVGEDPPGESV